MEKEANEEINHFNVKRIAIGSKVFLESCSLIFEPGRTFSHLTLKYKLKNKTDIRENKISDKDIRLLKYCIIPHDDTEKQCEEVEKKELEISQEAKAIHSGNESSQSNLLVLDVAPNNENKLSVYRSAYQPDSDHLNVKKRYVVIQFCETNDLNSLLGLFRNIELLKTMIETGHMSQKDIPSYASSLKLEKQRVRSYLRHVKQDEVVLNFPFEVTYAELDNAAKGLTEICGSSIEASSDVAEQQDRSIKSDQDEIYQNVWKHSLTVRGEDYERLRPGEYLNDTLLDLWMIW